MDFAGNLYFNDYGQHRVRRYDNTPPQAFAGPDITVEENEMILVQGAAWDAEEQTFVAMEWHLDGQVIAWSAGFSTMLPAGTHELTAVARDGFGGTGVDDLQITVRPDVPAAVTIVTPRDIAVPSRGCHGHRMDGDRRR